MDVEIRRNEDATQGTTSSKPRDRGFTYVEVVITIVLMGIVVLPILAAVRSSVRAAAVSREAAEVETVLINAADLVTRADRDVFRCDLTGPAQQAADLEWGDPSAISVTHEYWDDVDDVWRADPSGSGCPGGVWRNGLVQRIAISVASPNQDVQRTMEVVKGEF